MKSLEPCLLVLSVVILWSTTLALQRPPPRYSQQYMPETAFTCRNKIVGSYYADPETDCQVFHVCVSVSGSIQDYKFLCPNDTAFDQESQTCADWYDVDCEAATLYYASDNFDLYRLGSGLESPHYDTIRTDDEPQDNLQRSESNDPVRSSANALSRVSSTNYNTNNNNNNNNNNREVLHGSSKVGFYNQRTNKEDNYDNERSYKDETVTTEKKKTGIRKVSRKQPYNGNTNDYPVSSTAVPSTYNSQNNYNGNFVNNNYNQRSTSSGSSSTSRPQENYNRNQNIQKYTVTASSTYRPNTNFQDSYSSYQPPSSTARSTVYNTYNTNSNYNQDNSGSYTSSTTLRTTNYNSNGNRNGYQPYNVGQFTQSSTVLPSTNYQTSDYTNYQKNYNVQRGNGNGGGYRQSTTIAPTVYDNNYSSANEQYRNGHGSTTSEISQTTSKYFTNYAGNSYAPTTYSPPTKKYVHTDNSPAQSVPRSNDRYNSQQSSDNSQYYEKNDQTIKSSTQHYDSTKTSKKATQYNNYESSNSNKYYVETSTDNYDFGRASVGIGFSPASINHLAETSRSTTPVPSRRQASATTYNPSSFNSNTQKPSSINTTPRSSTYVSGSARPFTSTTRFISSTTVRPKSGKKNDYDYAYYDNAGGPEYDGLELEQVTGNKESSKLSRN
ncbi:GATA zinc finger domain-containing protein 14-like [Polistes fuscatus]|uniref:GATA zinc finger domain-containing protein 14-like n=1 Tax=Polistes fuscatus TaxID=30207 RepID=UPI001CAA138D|nr:GATA zinc finger domain-containing protein 14-like [Polistes fuscatus]